MSINFPPISEIKGGLERLGHSEVQELSKTSEVPFTTLWNIRSGATGNPGVETVRKFYPFMLSKIASLAPSEAKAA